MVEKDVIIVNGIPDAEYDTLIEKCVRYALLSLPFTVNRMTIADEKQRALNIAKGKIAEELFSCFCRKNHIPIDIDTCSTPFWTVDKRDFLLENCEWDLKNNFIYHSGESLEDFNYTDLPALVPNRFEGDQWSKKDEKFFPSSRDVGFLFTFIKNSDLQHGKRGKEFLELLVSEEQTILLKKLYQRYEGKPQPNQPFPEDRFWDAMAKRGSMAFCRLNCRPNLVITGFANSSHRALFQNVGSHGVASFVEYKNPFRYERFEKARNGRCAVSYLPSFVSLFTHLRSEIRCAEIKSIG